MKHSKPTRTYALNVIGYEGATPDFRFAFSATDDADAERKAFAWVRYQGWSWRDITISPATAEQALCLHDEYIPRSR